MVFYKTLEIFDILFSWLSMFAFTVRSYILQVALLGAIVQEFFVQRLRAYAILEYKTRNRSSSVRLWARMVQSGILSKIRESTNEGVMMDDVPLIFSSLNC